jgi:hypothetical protein
LSIELKEDEKVVLEEYRMAKLCRFADILISVDKGALAKVWTTSKRSGDDLKTTRRLKEGQDA